MVNELKGIRIVAPLGYLDFLLAMSKAALIVTDSGGVQEEACILRVPVVTLRNTTERPETIEVGANILAPNRTQALKAAKQMLNLQDRSWENPFGDGHAAKRCLELMMKA